MSRYVLIKGIEDDINIKIYGFIELMMLVMNKGKAISNLVYKANIKGEDIIDLVNKYHFPMDDYQMINPNNIYELTAFDD